MSRLLLVPIAASALTVIGCQQKNEFVAPPPPVVTVAQPLQEDVVDYFQTTGQTRAVNTVELRARVNGYLQEIAFKDGDLVDEGDLLFVIDKAPYEAILASAEADVAKADAALRLATAQLGRTRTLVGRNAATKDQLDEAEAQRASAVADVAAAKAAVRQAELDLGYTEIRAPFAGRMGEHQIDIGNLVQSGATLLATLETVDPIHAYFSVSESDLLRFIGMRQDGRTPMGENTQTPIEMALGEKGDFVYRGRLDFGEFGVDTSTGTTLRRAVFDNPDGRLVPGLWVKVRLAIGEPQPRLLVEERAISSDQRGDYLLIVNDENVVEYRPVQLGQADIGLRVILSGLNAGEQVVVNGLQRARPGSTVDPELAEMSAQQGAEPTAFRIIPGTAVAEKN